VRADPKALVERREGTLELGFRGEELQAYRGRRVSRGRVSRDLASGAKRWGI
jgi:hypothetical protein